MTVTLEQAMEKLRPGDAAALEAARKAQAVVIEGEDPVRRKYRIVNAGARHER